MASKEGTAVASCPNDDVSPQVGVFVTADVRVVQYGSSDSLGFCDSTKCTIVTSLSAVINKCMSESFRSQPYSRSKECIAGALKTIGNEVYDHPIVRRSKKHTQLNSVIVSDFTVGRRAQIDRTILLPYSGCKRRFEPFRSYNACVVAKLSKSWETVTKSNKVKNVKPFRSQIFNSGGSIYKTSSELNFLDYHDLVTSNKRLGYSFQEYELPNTGFNTSKQAVRSFYLIKTPTSAATTFSGLKNKFIEQNVNPRNPASLRLNNSELHKNITGFEGEMFARSPKLSLKTTRNVSILHRPKTRDKSTSTTFLDGCNVGQDLDKSFQGLLMPYISNSKDFPSEIVLKLVPRAEALKNSSIENNDQTNRSKDSSEVDLLAPTLNPETKLKKKKGKSFWNCFSRKKNFDDAESNDVSNIEIYYPSIVEVRNKKKKFSISESNSGLDINSSVCSFYNKDKKNKR